jgi:L-fuconolactonase
MMPDPSRREVLAGAAALLSAQSLPKPRFRGDPRMIPLLDTHQHLWDLDRIRPPWLPASGPLAGVHDMARYLKEAEGLNIVKTLYMEVDVAPADHDREADTVLALCDKPRNPMVGAIIGGRPADEGFARYIGRFAGDRRVRGVRQVLHGGTPAGYCLERPFVESVRRLGAMGLRFDVCVRAAELPDAAKLADLCPETVLILDHCGNPSVQVRDLSQWRKDIAEVARRPNVWCKISGIVATAKPGEWSAADLAPIVLHCAEVFGRDRILWASDWPVCKMAATLAQWVRAAQEIVADWPEADRRKLFYKNGHKAYGLT